MHKIAFICVDYNGYDCTRKFCDSLEQQAGKDDDFLLTCVVVDNCPQGEASAQLSDMVASRNWAVYLPSEKNVGYFGGLNLGLTSIDSDGWDFVVICNNDLEFDVDFCKKLISARYSDAVFAVCPDVVTRDGFHQNPHLLHRIGLLRRFQFDLYFSNYWMARFLSLILRLVRRNKPSPPRIHGGGELHMGIGACYVLTREFLRRFKTLNFPHFLYGEEAFFSNQIHSAGGVLWFDPDLLVHHAESAATSKMPKRATYEFARESYSDYRNML